MVSRPTDFLLLVHVLVLLTYSEAAVSPYESSLIFFYGSGYNSSTTYNLTDAVNVLSHKEFTNNETHCFLHGWTETINSESVATIKSAYSKRRTVNLLVLNWDKAAGDEYIVAALENIEPLSKVLADVFLSFFEAGLKRESFTIVGHSLGAQLTGLTGRNFYTQSNSTMKLYSIVALDAAFPLFVNRLPGIRSVNKDDADFLQSIHTDVGTFGTPFGLSHVDFWPNGGRRGQPGCPSFSFPFSEGDLCNHKRSWMLWAESVIPGGTRFWAFPASSYYQFLSEDIEPLKSKAIEMGFNCPRSARGNYYLKTNSKPEFAIGLDGY